MVSSSVVQTWTGIDRRAADFGHRFCLMRAPLLDINLIPFADSCLRRATARCEQARRAISVVRWSQLGLIPTRQPRGLQQAVD